MRWTRLVVAGLIWCTLAGLGPANAQTADKIVRDWIALCGNENCTLASRAGAGREEMLTLVRLTDLESWAIFVSGLGSPDRSAMPDYDRPLEIRINGKAPLTLRPGGGYRPFADLATLVVTDRHLLNSGFSALLNGQRARISYIDLAGAPHDLDFSLSGLTAVMLWADERQGRVGGKRRAAAPADMPPLPAFDKTAILAARGVPPQLVSMHRLRSDCEDIESEHLQNFAPVIGTLSGTAMLYALPCTAGAYNVAYRLYVVESGEIGGIETLYFANFSETLGWTGTDLLFNITFDDQAKELTALYKGRGIGDCGNFGVWRWQGFAFAMQRFRARDVCTGKGGPDDWPQVYPRR